MLYFHWILCVLGFVLVGLSENSDSIQANLGVCLFIYSLPMIIYLMKRKPKQKVMIQQIQTEGDEMKVQNVNVEQHASVGKMEVKRGIKKDSQVFKLIKLGMILATLIGLSILGVETIKALALVIAIALACIIALFLFIGLPLIIVFKDTIRLFIQKIR